MDNEEQMAPYVIPPALIDSPGFLLNRSARIIRDMNNTVLKPLGLSVRDLGLLRVIGSEGPLTQQELSSKHKTDRTTIVEVIDGLEERKLVVRSTNVKDRRSYLLTITPRGAKLLAAANKMTDKEKRNFLQALNDDEWQNLRALLTRIIIFHESREPCES